MRLGLAHLGLGDDLLLVGRVLRVEHGERLAEGAREGGREDEADLARAEGAHAAQPVLARDLQVERGVLARLGDLDRVRVRVRVGVRVRVRVKVRVRVTVRVRA